MAILSPREYEQENMTERLLVQVEQRNCSCQLFHFAEQCQFMASLWSCASNQSIFTKLTERIVEGDLSALSVQSSKLYIGLSCVQTYIMSYIASICLPCNALPMQCYACSEELVNSRHTHSVSVPVRMTCLKDNSLATEDLRDTICGDFSVEWQSKTSMICPPHGRDNWVQFSVGWLNHIALKDNAQLGPSMMSSLSSA